MFSFLRKKDAQAESTSVVSQSVEPTSSTAVDTAEEKNSLFGRLKQRLSRSSSKLTNGFSSLILGKKTIDDDLLEELETL
ncbi:MAG: fused signal recognition particle receptor, partial [Methylophagaceae bacterium]